MSSTVYHYHHIIPRHMGGTDDDSNLVKLTVEEHAQAHKLLWEQYGKEEDRIAWLALSGQASSSEVKKMRQRMGLERATETIRQNPDLCRKGGETLVEMQKGIHNPDKKLKSKGGKISIKILQKSKWLWVTDGEKDTRVTPEMLDEFLIENPTYRRGRTFSPNKGRTFKVNK